MRILLCLLLFLLLGINYSTAQKIVLDELLSTKNEFISEVFDNGEVVGYLIIYRKDNSEYVSDIMSPGGLKSLLFSTTDINSNKIIKLEYRFLDRNLNLVIEGNFNTVNQGKFMSAEIMNNAIFLKKRYYGNFEKMSTSFLLLPLKSEMVEPKEMTFINENMVPIDTQMHIEMKNQSQEGKYNQIYQVFKSGENNFLLTFSNHNNGRLNAGFTVFNIEMERVFQYSIPITKKGPYSFLMPVGVTDSYLLFTESHMKSPTNMNKRELLVFSKESFTLLHRHVLEDKEKPHLYQLKFREFDGMIYLSGAYCEFNGQPYYSPNDFIGFYLMVFDKSVNRIIEKHTIWKNFDERLDLRKSVIASNKNFLEDFQVLGVDTIFYILGSTRNDNNLIKAKQHNFYGTNIDRFSIVKNYKSFILTHDFKLGDLGDSVSLTTWQENDQVHFTHFNPKEKIYTMVIEKIPKVYTLTFNPEKPGYVIHSLNGKSSNMSGFIPNIY